MSKEEKATHDHYPNTFIVESLDTQRMNVATNTSLKLNVDFVERSAMKKSNAITRRIKPTTPKSKKMQSKKKSFSKSYCIHPYHSTKSVVNHPLRPMMHSR